MNSEIQKINESISRLTELLDDSGDYDEGVDTDNFSKIKVNRLDTTELPPTTDLIRNQTGGDSNPLYSWRAGVKTGAFVREGEYPEEINTDRIVGMNKLANEFNARSIVPVLNSLMTELKKYDTANPNTAIIISSVLADMFRQLPLVTLTDGQKRKLIEMLTRG